MKSSDDSRHRMCTKSLGLGRKLGWLSWRAREEERFATFGSSKFGYSRRQRVEESDEDEARCIVRRRERETNTIERTEGWRGEGGEERIVSQLNYSHSRGPRLFFYVGASSIPLLLVEYKGPWSTLHRVTEQSGIAEADMNPLIAVSTINSLKYYPESERK